MELYIERPNFEAALSQTIHPPLSSKVASAKPRSILTDKEKSARKKKDKAARKARKASRSH